MKTVPSFTQQRVSDGVRLPVQLSMKWCFAAVAVVAVLLAINAWLLGIPLKSVAPNDNAGYLAIMSFATAYFYVVYRPTQAMTHSWFIIAWCFALVDIVLGMIDAFQIINPGPRSLADSMLDVSEAVLSGTVLPALLTIPIVWLVLRRGGRAVSRAGCWFTVTLMLAFIDIVLTALLIVSIMGCRNFGGTVYWTFGPK